MTTVMTDPLPTAPRDPKANRLGLVLKEYQGAESTLCAGCGHDAITSSIVKAFFEMGVEPYRVAKLSGIGCSSKTTNYFMGQAHGINSVHGRMAAVATGASLANRVLVSIGISGDGDTASIGLSHFLHMVRRNVPIIYVIENNGCYGLTKGQFSATADRGSVKKGGLVVNQSLPIDCCALAIQMGCGFVARTFSGDTKQVRTLLKAAIAYRGTAVLDIVSPCVTFNNHEGSTKSVAYARENEDPLHEIGFVPHYEQITVEYDSGTTKVVEMPDGSTITLSKLDHDYDSHDRIRALALLDKAREELLFYTGLIYYNGAMAPLDQQMNLVDEPLATLPESRVRPSRETLAEIMESFQ
ncbi:MAG: 2-oxoacid:ferredoxin oxidoreductase subunit beta [Candidatus Hydrogenedentes bacterium]|nr:2-oxoacid:ferredoxin oxidoreductase subunit beta [Candidatus Hydrogenedentota bacterium]